jgi:hypothetical protein
VAFVPRRLIATLAKQLSLKTVTPPLDPGFDEQHMFYPTRAQFDPGSIWLRKLMLETAAGWVSRNGDPDWRAITGPGWSRTPEWLADLV